MWMFLGICLCIGSIRLSLGGFSNPGPGFLPFLAGGLLGILGFALIWSNYLRGLKKDEEVTKILPKDNRKKLIIPFLTLLILFVYVLLIELLGFLFSTFIFLFFLFKLTQPQKWVIPLILSIMTVILSHLVFSVWLRCQFPKGIFRF